MKHYIKTLIYGFCAGIAIAIGGWIYIKMLPINSVLAAILFSIALSLICLNGYYLYTGKICYLFDPSEFSLKTRIFTVLIGLVSNYLSVLIMANILKLSFTQDTVNTIIQAKLNLTWYDCLIRGFGCGLLVYFAVESFNNSVGNITGFFILVMAVTVFILSGFEHSIADMFYLSLDNTISWTSVLNIILIIIGNSIGGLLIPCLKKITKD